MAANAASNLRPSYSVGRVSSRSPPKISRMRALNRTSPCSTSPSKRAMERDSVASMMVRNSQENPKASLKRALASYLVPTPSRESAAWAASMKKGSM